MDFLIISSVGDNWLFIWQKYRIEYVYHTIRKINYRWDKT